MSAIEFANLQDIARGILASQIYKSAELNILPSFSAIFFVDFKQALSNEEFKQTIHGFFTENNIIHHSQITPKPAVYTPHLLNRFASKAYTDYETDEIDAQNETRFALPDGWMLLTTASNIM